jgi:hypothetical protein
MVKQVSNQVKKALFVLLVVSVVVSLTAASVSACSSNGKLTLEKGTCAKSMMEKAEAPSEKDTYA